MAAALPSLRRSSVWSKPEESCVYAILSSKGVMLHCPSALSPTATAPPSLPMSTVWPKPAEILMSFPHPKAGCCIVPDHSHQQQQRSHHPEKHCILKACSNLGVCHSLIQRWDVALSMVITSDGNNNNAITPEKHCMIRTYRDLGVCETLLVNYPQMSSARGRALSEQRRHPIHRAKKPWTNTKRPASNQPRNKRGETQAIANDINSKSCRDQHSTLRAMPKFPNGSLHKNKPSMNTIHVSIHTRNDPPKPSHKKLTRLGRDIHVAWTTRTRPSNMVKTANVMTTRPNTSVSNIKILGTVQRSRRKRTPCRQSTRLRPRSCKLPNTIPINSVKQTVFKAIKIIVPPSGLTMFVETPSAPSSTDHMLTSTGIINDSKIKNRTRQSMTPFPVSVTDPSMRTKPILQRASRRSRHRRPSQSPPALNTRQNSNQLSSKQHVQVKPTTEKSCPKPDRGASQPPTTHVHTRKKGFAQRQRRSPSNPPISHLRVCVCVLLPHSNVGCWIVHFCCIQWRQHCHHSREALCNYRPQTSLPELWPIWYKVVGCVGDRPSTNLLCFEYVWMCGNGSGLASLLARTAGHKQIGQVG